MLGLVITAPAPGLLQSPQLINTTQTRISGPTPAAMRRRATTSHTRREASSPSSVTSSSATDLNKAAPESAPTDKKKAQLPKDGLVASLAIVIAHLAFGTLSLVALEGWTFVNALYFCVVSTTTVGFGDITPMLPRSKLFVSLYALVSVLLIGNAMGRVVEGCIVDGSRRMVQGDVTDVRGGQQRAHKAQMIMVRSIVAWLVVIGVGALTYGLLLGLAWIDVLYFVTASLTTIGWGDLHPVTNSGKLFAVLWLIIAAGGFVSVVTRVLEWRSALNEQRLMEEVCSGKMSAKLWNDIDANEDGKVSETEFLAGALVNMGKTTREEVDDIRKRFVELDVDENNYVDKDEINLAP